MIATSAKKNLQTPNFLKISYSLQIHIPFSLYSIFGEKKTKYNFSFAIPLCIPPTAPRLLFYRGNKSANYSRPRDSLLPSCPPAIKRFIPRLLLLRFFSFFCVFHARNFAKFERIRDFSSRARWNRIEKGGGRGGRRIISFVGNSVPPGIVSSKNSYEFRRNFKNGSSMKRE